MIIYIIIREYHDQNEKPCDTGILLLKAYSDPIKAQCKLNLIRQELSTALERYREAEKACRLLIDPPKTTSGSQNGDYGRWRREVTEFLENFLGFSPYYYMSPEDPSGEVIDLDNCSIHYKIQEITLDGTDHRIPEIVK